MSTRFSTLAAGVAFALLASGCNLTGLLIKAQTDGVNEASDYIGPRFADPDLIGPVLRDSIATTEGMMYYVDDYEPLLRSYILARVGYGLIWLGEESHKLEIAGEYEKAEHINDRAALLFQQALVQAKRMLRLRDDGFDAAQAGGLAVWRKWIDENFYREEDADVLLLAGATYFVGALSSEEGLAGAVDIPYARYMVERSVELNNELQGAQGLMILGIYECTMPELMGGKPDLGMKLLSRAAEITERGNHGILLQMAERCAVAKQDRKLFHALLMEIIEAPDVAEYRMFNKIARHRAERLLGQIDEFFYD